MPGPNIDAFRKLSLSRSAYVVLTDDLQKLQTRSSRKYKGLAVDLEQNAAVRRALFNALSADTRISGAYLKDLERQLIGEETIHQKLTSRDVRDLLKAHDARNASVAAYQRLFSGSNGSTAPVTGFQSLVRQAGYSATSVAGLDMESFRDLINLSCDRRVFPGRDDLLNMGASVGSALTQAYMLKGADLKSSDTDAIVDKAVEKLFDLEAALRDRVNDGTLQLTDGLELLMDYCAARASELMTVWSEAKAAGDALDDGVSLRDLMAAKATTMHGNAAFVEKTEAKVAGLENELAALRDQVAANDTTTVPEGRLASLTAEFEALAATLVKGEDLAHEGSLGAALLSRVQRDIADLNEIRHIDVGRQARAIVEDLVPDLVLLHDDRQKLLSVFNSKGPIDRKAFSKALGNLEDDIGNGLTKKNFKLLERRLAQLLQRLTQVPGHDGYKVSPQILQRLLNGEIGLGTAVGAYAHGFSAEDVDPAIDDRFVVSSRPLGQGAANVVYEVTYKLPDGTETTRVFKPEENGRAGLDRMMIGHTGYSINNRIGEINLATRRAAEKMGCPETAVKVTVGVHQGKIGFFMEKAGGETAHKAAEPEKKLSPFSKSGCQHLSKPQLVARFGTLARQVCKLEWQDWLTGQLDRHHKNYLVQWDNKAGKSIVKGIDNDAAFMDYRIGLTRFVVDDTRLEILKDAFGTRRIGKLQERLGEGALTTDAQGRRVLDVSKVTSAKALFKLRDVFGINSCAKPVRIPAALANWLKTLRATGDYAAAARDMMKGRFTEAQVAATAARLKEMAEYAQELENRPGAVMEEEDWLDETKFGDFLRDAEADMRAHKNIMVDGEVAVRNPLQNYFTRDFRDSLELFH